MMVVLALWLKEYMEKEYFTCIEHLHEYFLSAFPVPALVPNIGTWISTLLPIRTALVTVSRYH